MAGVMPSWHILPDGLCHPHAFAVCEEEVMALLNAVCCSADSHRVAGSADGLGHQVPPSSLPVSSAKSRGPKLLRHWVAAPGRGHHWAF